MMPWSGQTAMARLKWIHLGISIGAAAVCMACVSLPDILPTPATTVKPPVDSNNYASASPTPTGSGGPSASPSPTPSNTVSSHATYLHQVGGNISDAASNPIVLRGIGWFGFEYSSMLDTAPSPNRLGTDVGTILQRLRLMGFNLIHVSFSFSRLYNPDGSYVMNPTTVHIPCPGSSSYSAIVNSVSLPGFAPGANIPLLGNVPTPGAGMCNDYLPDLGASVVARLAAIVDIFTRNGMYVLLQENINEDVALTMDAQAYANQWTKFVGDLVQYGGAFENMAQPSCSADPNNAPLLLCHNVILGLMSNLDKVSTNSGINLTMEPNNGVTNVGAHQLYRAAFDALSPAMPRAMFMVHGGYQFGLSTTFNIGVDSRTGPSFPSLAGPASVGSAASFFSDVLNKPVESQLLFGFSAFGPTLDHWLYNFVSSMNSKIAADFDPSFGGLQRLGVADGQNAQHLFPTMPTTLGGMVDDANDMTFLNAMQGYMNAHNMHSFIWWCFNGQTSTGSNLVDPTNYTTLDPDVINYLKTLGLQPPS